MGFEPTNIGFANRRPEFVNNDKTSTYNKPIITGTHQGTQLRAPEAQIDPDLQAIIDHWKDLPEHIKQTIKTLAGVGEGE